MYEVLTDKTNLTFDSSLITGLFPEQILKLQRSSLLIKRVTEQIFKTIAQSQSYHRFPKYL